MRLRRLASPFALGRSPQHRSADTLLWAARGIVAGLIVLFAGLQAAGVRLSITVQSVVYLVGMVALNLPHGGFEHANNLWRRPAAFVLRYLAFFFVGIGLFVGLLFWHPAVGLGLALTVAMVKGGHGGLHVLDAVGATEHLQSRIQRGLAAVVRGGAVMIVPMIAWPGMFLAISQYMVNIFEPGALGGVAAQVPTIRASLAAGYGTVVVLHLALGYLAGGRRASWGVDGLETGLLIAYFAVVPVLVAVGLYFAAWYSLRQVARAVATGDDAYATAGADGDAAPLLAQLKTLGTFLGGSLATFGLMAALYVGVPSPMGGAPFWPGLVAFYSIFVSIIALPHIVVGAWLDREHGIWYVP
jgi:Brp/Blh family beta-carotene 15,15'-monooxygenase